MRDERLCSSCSRTRGGYRRIGGARPGQGAMVSRHFRRWAALGALRHASPGAARISSQRVSCRHVPGICGMLGPHTRSVFIFPSSTGFFGRASRFAPAALSPFAADFPAPFWTSDALRFCPILVAQKNSREACKKPLMVVY